jgi:hypothetical protein
MTEYTRWHLRVGWWSLAVFATLGLGLELLHAFKAGVYLDVAHDTRRLMWTLAHAHGIGLGLVHIAFAWTVQVHTATVVRVRLASRCLTASSVLLPGGFFLGGVSFYGGDPGLGVALVPAGAILVLVALVATARSVTGVSQ